MLKVQDDYKRWIQQLNLIAHPEGGFFCETYRSEDLILPPSRYQGKRTAGTAIYYLLRSEDFSAFHKVNSDEIWHFYAGSRLILYVIKPNGDMEIKKIGYDTDGSAYFQATVKANQWFAAEVDEKNSYALVGCTVSPGFDFEDFVLGDRKNLTKTYPQHTQLITRLTHP